MIIKDNFGADKKDQNTKRVEYMTDIENRQAFGSHKFSGDSKAAVRVMRVDELGNPKRMRVDEFLYNVLVGYLKGGNTIDTVDYSINYTNEELQFIDKWLNLVHKIYY